MGMGQHLAEVLPDQPIQLGGVAIAHVVSVVVPSGPGWGTQASVTTTDQGPQQILVLLVVAGSLLLILHQLLLDQSVGLFSDYGRDMEGKPFLLRASCAGLT